MKYILSFFLLSFFLFNTISLKADDNTLQKDIIGEWELISINLVHIEAKDEKVKEKIKTEIKHADSQSKYQDIELQLNEDGTYFDNLYVHHGTYMVKNRQIFMKYDNGRVIFKALLKGDSLSLEFLKFLYYNDKDFELSEKISEDDDKVAKVTIRFDLKRKIKNEK